MNTVLGWRELVGLQCIAEYTKEKGYPPSTQRTVADCINEFIEKHSVPDAYGAPIHPYNAGRIVRKLFSAGLTEAELPVRLTDLGNKLCHELSPDWRKIPTRLV